MSNSARYENGLVYIVCPHCSHEGKYATGYFSEAVADGRGIRCTACEEKFNVVITVPDPQRSPTLREAVAPKQTCPSCNGRGYWTDGYDNDLECRACKGTGQV